MRLLYISFILNLFFLGSLQFDPKVKRVRQQNTIMFYKSRGRYNIGNSRTKSTRNLMNSEDLNSQINETMSNNLNNGMRRRNNIRIQIRQNSDSMSSSIRVLYPLPVFDDENESPIDEEERIKRTMIRAGIPDFIQSMYARDSEKAKKSSENFEIAENKNFTFSNVGGYEKVKEELLQCGDILVNYSKYDKYNVRTPRGIILEGSPGNGKTIMAKAFCGELNISFIPTTASVFQEKYVGVGSARIRELFSLAKSAKPGVIFIDEIDAIGRMRSSSEQSGDSGERDSTLNQLLTMLDGFDDNNGIFLMCATNRIDLLDNALLRPGRIDKKIFVGNPDADTREAIINIHISGKPIDETVDTNNLIKLMKGMSGAQIENVLNEAMLKALREDREKMNIGDIDANMERLLVGSQSTKNKYSSDAMKRIAIHELGHAIVGLVLKDHPNPLSISLNEWSHKAPGYTLFDTDEEDSNIITKEYLMQHLSVLLAGRVAEIVFFNSSITTGASKDLHDAYQIAENMVLKYGMGSRTIYTTKSDISKKELDDDIQHILIQAEKRCYDEIRNNYGLFLLLYKKLISEKSLNYDEIVSATMVDLPSDEYKFE